MNRKRSNFSLSHQKKFTGDMGYLIPITWMEALPGDIFKHGTTALIRMSPLVSPVMHRVFVRIHHWFVPNRLLWDDWKDFYTGGEDGNFTSVHPYVQSLEVTEGSLLDYLGVPTNPTPAQYMSLNALPVRAYNKIYNEFYRDQDLGTEQTINTASGKDLTTNTTMLKASWPKDYFTTARPWEQKGDEVVIPISGSAPLTGMGSGTTGLGTPNITVYETDGTASQQYALGANYNDLLYEKDPNNAGYPNLRTDLSQATGIPINDLRLALALQRDKESKAQFGSRYSEVIAHEYGVKSQDSRLQRPEYLGGGKSVVSFSEVLSTDGDNTGNLFGHGISAMKTNSYRRFIPEHGIIMSLMSVIPEPLYTSGIHRSFLRKTKEDYFDKDLEYIGEQEITNEEVQNNHSDPYSIFGYQKRYEEYRYMPNTIAGAMNSTLNTWHYGREFTGDIALNQSFTDCTPTKRTQADLTADTLIVTAHHNVVAKRVMAYNPMPKTF